VNCGLLSWPAAPAFEAAGAEQADSKQLSDEQHPQTRGVYSKSRFFDESILG
jgi:hypothetical protein